MDVKTVNYKKKDAPKILTSSLRRTGFAVLTDHPISISLINDAYEQWKQFFFTLRLKKNIYLIKTLKMVFFLFGTENAKGHKEKDLKEFYHIYSWGKYPDEINQSTKILF